jgi:hypothetical protein
MIKWSECSFNEITERWDQFYLDRNEMTRGSNKKPKSHLTVEDRERLIDELITRLDNAQACIVNAIR